LSSFSSQTRSYRSRIRLTLNLFSIFHLKPDGQLKS
jgi:hypothetical protein